MSNPRGTDESVRDAAVEAAWRAASTEEPTSRSDASILAAARAEVRSQQRPARLRHATPWWIRWQPLAAAAGLAGLAFLVVQRLPTEAEHTNTFEAPARTAPAAVARPEADNVAGAAGGAEVSIAEPPQAMQPKSTTSAAEAPPPRAVEAPQRRNAVADRPSAQDSTGDLATAPLLESPTPLSRQQAAGIAAERPMSDVLDADDWVQRIIANHEAGNLSAAADELRAFRLAYPDADARLPADLQQWASSVDTSDQR